MKRDKQSGLTETERADRRLIVVTGGGLVVGSMILAACGDDDSSAVANTAAGTGTNTDTPAKEMLMDEFATADAKTGVPVPDALKALFNNADEVRVQKFPCLLPGMESKAVHFNAGARTVPHKHAGGQHIIITEGTGVFGDEAGVHIVKAGDVIANPPTGWHWHGALPSEAMSHVTVEAPGLDLDVEPRDYDEVYTKDLGKS